MPNRNSTEVIELNGLTREPLSALLPFPQTVGPTENRMGETSIASEPQLVRNESALEPVDSGFGAWSFLVAAFFVEMIVWGFPTAFGAFLAEYLKNPVYLSQEGAASLLPLIGPLSSGIIYCSGPFIYPFTSRHPQWRRSLMLIGGFLCWVSLFGASYVTKVIQLVALQGVLYAIGGSLLYAPCISYMSEWFVKKRGLANGIIFAGTATGGLILPLIIPRLIATHGVTMTLRFLSVAVGAMLIPCYPFLKGRLPSARIHGPAARSSDRAWLTNKSFWFLVAVNTVQGFGYFVPTLWLPTFASDLNISDSNSSLTLAILNGASAVGMLSMGHMSDKFDPWLLGLATLSSTAFATFVLWGVLSNSFAGLMAFGIVYGIIAGGWSTLWTSFVKPIAKDDLSLSTSLFGYLLLSRGIGNIASTPISTSLLRSKQASSLPHHSNTGFDVGEGRFEDVILYAGTCFAAASLIAVVGWGTEKSRAQRGLALI